MDNQVSGVLAVGHRGAPKAATENTLPSITEAVRAGAHWVEVDVKLTSDAVPVLLHDRTLWRIWGLRQEIGQAALDGLPGREVGREPRIPTLREGLEVIRGSGARLMIDLPSAPEAAPSIDLVQRLGMVDQAMFTGDTDALAQVRSRAADAVIALTWDHPSLPGETVLTRIRPQYVNQPHILLDVPAAAAIHAAGMLVSTFTVDHPDEMRRMADIGADAVISNDIAVLTAMLATRAAGGAP